MTCPELATVVVLDDASRASLDRGVDAGAPDAVELVGPQYRDVHSLMFTSGTTGPSKAVITPWAVMYQFWSWVPDDALVSGDGLYCAMPLFHNSGRSAFNYAMARNARFVLRDRFSASDFWSDIRATGCVTAALVGPMTALLHSAPPRDDDADSPLRNAILGPMIPDIEAFERRFGVRVATGYGQTETGMAVTTGWDHGPWANCGRIREDYPWPEVRIADEFDEPVPDGEVGELLVRSAEPWALNVGYHKMPEQTAAAWRNGWFHTGDAFRRDADGWFYFVDRLRDTIRRRGENISSFEVETLVVEHPSVRECAAIGVPAPLGEDDVFVAVIVDDPATFDPAAAARVPRLAHAPVHAAPLRRGGRRPAAHRGLDAGPQARAARPRGHRHHLGPRGLLIWWLPARTDLGSAGVRTCVRVHRVRRLHPPRRPGRVLRLGRTARRPPSCGAGR